MQRKQGRSKTKFDRYDKRRGAAGGGGGDMTRRGGRGGYDRGWRGTDVGGRGEGGDKMEKRWWFSLCP